MSKDGLQRGEGTGAGSIAGAAAEEEDDYRYTVLTAAWNGVRTRLAQLEMLRTRMQVAEETLASLAPEQTESGALIIRDWDVWQKQFDLFGLEAESCLMFSAASLNTLAEAVAETWQVSRQRPWSFATLRDYARTHQAGDERAKHLSPLLPAMDAAHVRIVVPRNVVAAHPVQGRSSFLAGKHDARPMKLERWLLLPEVFDAEDEATRILELLSLEEAPKGSNREELLSWLFENAEGLDGPIRREVERYMQTFGCTVSPIAAVDETRSLLAEVATDVNAEAYVGPFEPTDLRPGQE